MFKVNSDKKRDLPPSQDNVRPPLCQQNYLWEPQQKDAEMGKWMENGWKMENGLRKIH